MRIHQNRTFFVMLLLGVIGVISSPASKSKLTPTPKTTTTTTTKPVDAAADFFSAAIKDCPERSIRRFKYNPVNVTYFTVTPFFISGIVIPLIVDEPYPATTIKSTRNLAKTLDFYGHLCSHDKQNKTIGVGSTRQWASVNYYLDLYKIEPDIDSAGRSKITLVGVQELGHAFDKLRKLGFCNLSKQKRKVYSGKFSSIVASEEEFAKLICVFTNRFAVFVENSPALLLDVDILVPGTELGYQRTQLLSKFSGSIPSEFSTSTNLSNSASFGQTITTASTRPTSKAPGLSTDARRSSSEKVVNVGRKETTRGQSRSIFSTAIARSSPRFSNRPSTRASSTSNHLTSSIAYNGKNIQTTAEHFAGNTTQNHSSTENQLSTLSSGKLVENEAVTTSFNSNGLLAAKVEEVTPKIEYVSAKNQTSDEFLASETASTRSATVDIGAGVEDGFRNASETSTIRPNIEEKQLNDSKSSNLFTGEKETERIEVTDENSTAKSKEKDNTTDSVGNWQIFVTTREKLFGNTAIEKTTEKELVMDGVEGAGAGADRSGSTRSNDASDTMRSQVGFVTASRAESLNKLAVTKYIRDHASVSSYDYEYNLGVNGYGRGSTSLTRPNETYNYDVRNTLIIGSIAVFIVLFSVIPLLLPHFRSTG